MMKKKKKQPTAAEMADGVRESEFGGREMNEVTQTRMGLDGIEETHVSFEPNKYSGYRKAGAGKGDKPRPMNRYRFRRNYDKIDWGR